MGGMEIEFPVEFVVHGTPISSQGSSASKKAWKKSVKDASYTALPEGHWWYEGEVAVTIYYFPSSPMGGDIDNIVKMTLDAMSAHILKNDKQVARVVVQRFNPDSIFAFSDPSEKLVEALTSEGPSVFIRLSSDVTEGLQ